MIISICQCQDPRAAEGEAVVLECRIQAGLEDNTISWDRAGRPVRETEEGGQLEIRSVVVRMMMMVVMMVIRVTDTGTEYVSQLVIAAATAEDFVSYGCEATNMLGYDYVTMQLRKSGIKLKIFFWSRYISYYILEEFNEEMWYIIIAVLAVLIILALLGFCFILGRRREKSNAELIKDANARERIKENEYVKEQYSQELKCRGPNPVSMISNDLVF